MKMSEREREKILICVTGHPGSGKSVFSSVGRKLGLKVFTMGDVVREEAKQRYGIVDKFTLGKVARELRDEYGDDAIAIILSRKISKIRDKVVIIDGIRSMDEIKIFSKIGKVYIIAILAKKITRFHRLVNRRREDDVKTYEDFVLRELRENNFGILDVIENSDVYILNENISLNTFIDISHKLFKELLDEIYEKEKT
ncbi:MAG TPA: dephospho-CoA kinase [Thermoprotei archaeon]|nr:dephospho-CoA kinase [Thermoprotei archaeon]